MHNTWKIKLRWQVDPATLPSYKDDTDCESTMFPRTFESTYIQCYIKKVCQNLISALWLLYFLCTLHTSQWTIRTKIITKTKIIIFLNQQNFTIQFFSY